VKPYRYSLVVRPVVTIDFDEHGNCRDTRIDFDVRPEYVYDNWTEEAFSSAELPLEVREMLTEHIESLALIPFFVPEPVGNEPF
jgi:hypothetical protein